MRAKVTRRLVLSAGFLAGAGVALTGCGRDDQLFLEASESASFSYFTPVEYALLSDVADILIPTTETVGAKDTLTIEYLDHLMQTWAGDATKREVADFVKELDSHAQAAHRNAYLNLSIDVRRELLQDIDAESFSSPSDAIPIRSYRRVKWLIFHIHHSSEAANSDFILIPGQYRGDISETEYLALVEENRY